MRTKVTVRLTARVAMRVGAKVTVRLTARVAMRVGVKVTVRLTARVAPRVGVKVTVRLTARVTPRVSRGLRTPGGGFLLSVQILAGSGEVWRSDRSPSAVSDR